MDIQADRWTYRQTDGHTDRQMDIHADRWTYRQTDGHTSRQMDIQADRWTWLAHNPELHIVPNTGSSTVFGQVHIALSQTNS